MSALDTASSAPTQSEPDPRRWSVRAALRASRGTTLVAAAVVFVVTAGAAFADEVPVAVAMTLIALIPAVLVDVLVRRLPNRLVGAAALVLGASVLTSALLGVDIRLLDLTLGAVAMAAPLLLVHLLSPASMGFGDVKAALVMGAALGLIDPVLSILALAIGSFATAIHGLVTRRRHIAFGPGLLGGAVVAIVLVASPVSVHHDQSSISTTAATARAIP